MGCVGGKNGNSETSYEGILIIQVRDGEGLNQGYERIAGIYLVGFFIRLEGKVDGICSGLETIQSERSSQG